jgi:flagellar biosynthetic protein FlhB
MESSQDRNLPASQRKLDKARADGQVARSQHLGHLAVLGSGALVLMSLAPMAFEHLMHSLSLQLHFNAAAIELPGDMILRMQDSVAQGVMVALAFAAIVVIAAVISHLSIGGWVFSLKPVMPDLNKLDPLKGLGNMFSKKKLFDIGKTSFLMLVLLGVAAYFLYGSIDSLALLIMQPSAGALPHLLDWLIKGLGLLLGVVFVVALIDVPLQMFLHKSELKMSLQEVKDEHRQSEGNPEMKSKRRAKQREMARRNSILKVPEADFVLMNPTHYAVAVKYDEATMDVPIVISKGTDLLAMKIKDIARSHKVPVIESPSLARALYANTELDAEIPTSLFTAVAQVLAYVYRLKANLRGDGPAPGDVPKPHVPPELDPLTSPLVSGAMA